MNIRVKRKMNKKKNTKSLLSDVGVRSESEILENGDGNTGSRRVHLSIQFSPEEMILGTQSYLALWQYLLYQRN